MERIRTVMTNEVMPFGKYKGQPLEVVAQDKSYLEWLTAQDWFRQRYAGIHTLIVNNFAEPSETPEHNALQVLFLDDQFCERFISVLNPEWKAKVTADFKQQLAHKKQALLELQQDKWASAETKAAYGEAAVACGNDAKWRVIFNKQFEMAGVDVALSCYPETIGKFPFVYRGEREIRWDILRSNVCLIDRRFDGSSWSDVAAIEIKPTVGDDYPAVLRQMRLNKSRVLFTQAYTGVGATEEQFIKTFATAGFRVVFERDVVGREADNAA